MNNHTDNARIYLTPMTGEMYRRYFSEYENDPALYADKSRFEPYVYSEEKVERYIARQKDLGRVTLAIMYGEEIAGEIVFKNIENGVSATMGLSLKNDAFKGRGIGTEAERQAILYAFGVLDVPTLYADALKSNARSIHVLKKVGFRFVREDELFAYFRVDRENR